MLNQLFNHKQYHKKTNLHLLLKWKICHKRGCSHNNEPVQFGKFEDRVMSVNHSPQGDKTVIGMDYEGNEKQQLYLLEEENLQPDSLVVEPEYFHHFGGWSPDGSRIAFSSNRRHPGYFDVFVVDVATKEKKKVFKNDGNCVPLKWLPDGKHIVINLPET